MPRKKIEYIACSQCGSQMPKGSAFCSACGAKIEEKKNEYIICKHCGNQTPKLSIYCMHCGSQLIRSKNVQDRKDMLVPEPRKMSSGKWYIYLRIDGKKYSITKEKKAECIAEAMAIKCGITEGKTKLKKLTLKKAMEIYIEANTGVLSPSTIRNYVNVKKNRFQSVIDEDVEKIEWQKIISEESGKIKPKTLINSWRFVKVALKYSDRAVPDVRLPQLVQKERSWLDYEQIQVFLEGIKGRSCELACLLALHSLRISEIMALSENSIVDGYIQVRGAVVPNQDNKYVFKETNKNETSRRDVPVMIPRLMELWPKNGEPLKLQALSPRRRMIERICKENNLPVISIHCLRHSFASLAYHLNWSIRTTCAVGGWSTPDCVERIYTHLSKLDKNSDIEKMKQFYNPQLISQEQK